MARVNKKDVNVLMNFYKDIHEIKLPSESKPKIKKGTQLKLSLWD